MCTLTGDRVSLFHDAPSGIEAIRARFSGHAYDMHQHDEWLVGVTERGVQDFYCRGARRQSTPGRVILIEPQEAHDGQAGHADGFTYAMLYLPRPWLKAALQEDGAGDPGFSASLLDDTRLGQAIWQAYGALTRPDSRLAVDAALDGVVDRLRPHLGRAEKRGRPGRDGIIARRVHERLRALPADDIGADALADEVGAVSRFQLARAFRAEYGTSPHQFLVQIRLQEARRLLAKGKTPADVASLTGFADQSHLGRWFRRAYGLTPAAYRATCLADRSARTF
ncbi:AraC family transcriptional regulator [Lacibacterium aquatile]|uniref:AraC family transcriptional regulator n=1 Tax=Lacibacterium aquatile TaxID=1168082 RepID=A0ABW5DXF0_9PROT